MLTCNAGKGGFLCSGGTGTGGLVDVNAKTGPGKVSVAVEEFETLGACDNVFDCCTIAEWEVSGGTSAAFASCGNDNLVGGFGLVEVETSPKI